MNRRMRQVALCLASMAVVAGCGQADMGDEQEGQPPQQWPQEAAEAPELQRDAAPGADGPEPVSDEEMQSSDPEAVIVAAAGELTTWYPVTENNRGASTVRAGKWLEPRLINDTPELKPDAQWMAWAEEGAKISSSVRIAAEKHPPDTQTQVTRAVMVEQIMHSPGGEQPVEPALAMWLTCTKGEDGKWRVSEFRY